MLKWIKSLFTKKKPLHLTPDEIIDLTLLTIHKPIVQPIRSKTVLKKSASPKKINHRCSRTNPAIILNAQKGRPTVIISRISIDQF